jgi:ADP-ribosyl-[dinitrogen reductase] hydrolase
MSTPALSTAQLDRAVGVLLGTAAGDALGAGYEFGPPLSATAPVAMNGGGTFRWAPGEWTDDTSMAWVIAAEAATGTDLRTPQAQDRIARAWAGWAQTAPDVGTQTRAVLTAARRAAEDAGTDQVTAAQLRAASHAQHEHTGRSAGNGSLMRTAPIALAYLHDEHALIDAATALSALTHHDPEAAEACVLWSLAIRHAVLTGDLDARTGLPHLAEPRRAVWARRLDDAETHEPATFDRNGWVVQALQAAWSAITHTPVPDDDPAHGCFRAQHLQQSLEAAVRGGRDTDTVAAIAGGLLGATYGATAVPAAWRRILHGWPGANARDLTALGTAIATGGAAPFDGDYTRYSETDTLAQHPYDEQLWIGGVGALRTLPAGVDAVVSLCRTSVDDVPTGGVEQVEIRLIDKAGEEENPNLGFVLHDTVALLEHLRQQGRTVLLHCVQAQSRTPTVAALYGARRNNVTTTQALHDIQHVLPRASPNQTFLAALHAAEAVGRPRSN